MHEIKKFLALSVLSATLIACGGSGGNDDTDNGTGTGGGNPGGGNADGGNSGGTPAFAMTVDAPSQTTDHSVVIVSVSLSGGSGEESIQASVRGSGNYEDLPGITYTDAGFNIEIGEVAYHQEIYQVTVTGSKGDDAKTEEFSITASSRIGDTWRERAELMNAIAPAQRMFIAEMVMIERLVKAVNLTGGDIDMKDLKPMYIDSMHKEHDILNRVYGLITQQAHIDRYNNGESRWVDSFKFLMENVSIDDCEPQFCANEYLMNVIPMFDYVFDNSQGALARPEYGEVQFDNGTGTYSIFYVDGDNGSFDESGTWQFKPELAYLSDLIIAGHEAALTFTAENEQPDTDEDA